MAKEKRPHHDETEIWPIARHLYSAYVTGRPGDGVREEPLKMTQALYQLLMHEEITEWEARLMENIMTIRKFLAKELKDPEKSTSYLSYPPIYAAKITLNAAATILVYGKSVDVCYWRMDDYTLEMHTFGRDWHYEDGYQTYGFRTDYEYGYEILERRHLKVGEMYKDLGVQRPMHIGGMLARDLILDIRNEQTPEYALSAMHWFGWLISSGHHLQSDSRSTAEALNGLWHFFNTDKQNWPYESWAVGMCPRPPALNLLLQNPVDLWTHRYNGLICGKNWSSRWTMTHMDTEYQNVGVEMVPPKFDESAFSIIHYGLDRYKFAESFRQSKYVYGEAARMREPTEYPLPEKTLIPIPESDKIIDEAREKHPEWMAGG